MRRSTNPRYMCSDVLAANGAILNHVAKFVNHYKRVNGLTDKDIAFRVGCCEDTISSLRIGRLRYCGISLLSTIAHSFGCSLFDWLQSPPPDVEI